MRSIKFFRCSKQDEQLFVSRKIFSSLFDAQPSAIIQLHPNEKKALETHNFNMILNVNQRNSKMLNNSVFRCSNQHDQLLCFWKDIYCSLQCTPLKNFACAPRRWKRPKKHKYLIPESIQWHSGVLANTVLRFNNMHVQLLCL